MNGIDMDKVSITNQGPLMVKECCAACGGIQILFGAISIKLARDAAEHLRSALDQVLQSQSEEPRHRPFPFIPTLLRSDDCN